MSSHNHIQWTASAWKDLEGITDYMLAQGESFESVDNFLQHIIQAPKYLERFPHAGKPGRMSKTREWRVQNTPYALIYAVREARVCILRVMHDSRQFP